jgi:uncharacterized repeat protein (TIGR01451 family)
MSARTKLLGACLILSGVTALSGRTAATDFAAAKSYTVGTGPNTVATADFNGDGKADLAVANRGSGNVSVLLGNGDGTFQSAVNYDAGIAAPEEIFVGDFNGDGKWDVLVFIAGDAANSVVGEVSVLLGNGDGTFQAGKLTALSVYATKIGVGDFNRDRKSDLVVGEFNTSVSLSIRAGNGDGTFQAAVPVMNPMPCAPGVAGTYCLAFVAADFDKDGKMDLIVAGGPGLEVLLGNGDGTFRNGSNISVADGYAVGFVATSDLNADGTADLLVMSAYSKCEGLNCQSTTHWSVFLGDGNGGFGTEKVFATGSSSRDEFGFGSSDGIGNILTGDFDGDGKPDIVDRHSVKTSSFPGAPSTVTMEVRLGLGDGTFAPPIVFPDVGIPGVAADLNGDKLADLVMIGASNDVDALLNDSQTSGADLSLTQTGATPEPVGVGQNLTYSATILNEGPEKATGVIFKNTLPGGVTFLSATSTVGSCSAANEIVTCGIGALARAANAQVTIVVMPATVGVIGNTMGVTANEADSNMANNNASQSSTVETVYTLTVTKSGTGTGTVSARAGVSKGINCGGVCSEKYLAGTRVALTAASDPNSTFGSWGGACSGTDCTVTMNGDLTVTATFAAQPDFQVTPTAASLVMPRGGQTSEPVSFDAIGGFTGQITVTCSVEGPAPMPSCNITPSLVAAGSSAKLAISGSTLSASLQPGAMAIAPRIAGAATLPFGVVTCLLAAGFDKRRRGKWLACMLVIAAGVLPVACGGGENTKLPPQTYVVTVTAQSGALSHTANVNVTVN